MNPVPIARHGAAIVIVSVLVSVAVIGSNGGEGPGTPAASSKPTTAGNRAASTPAGDAREGARVKRFILQVPSVRNLGGVREGDTTVKHLHGAYYVVRVGYARGHAWRLYLVHEQELHEIGIAAGERGLDLCLHILLGRADSEEARLAAIRKCLDALSADYGIVVQRNSDIPGYDKASLAKDLAGVVRPMWSYVTKGARGEPVTHYVVYTYQQISGQVFRHELRIGERGRSAITIRLATGVGDARYIQ